MTDSPSLEEHINNLYPKIKWIEKIIDKQFFFKKFYIYEMRDFQNDLDMVYLFEKPILDDNKSFTENDLYGFEADFTYSYHEDEDYNMDEDPRLLTLNFSPFVTEEYRSDTEHIKYLKLEDYKPSFEKLSIIEHKTFHREGPFYDTIFNRYNTLRVSLELGTTKDFKEIAFLTSCVTCLFFKNQKGVITDDGTPNLLTSHINKLAELKKIYITPIMNSLDNTDIIADIQTLIISYLIY